VLEGVVVEGKGILNNKGDIDWWYERLIQADGIPPLTMRFAGGSNTTHEQSST